MATLKQPKSTQSQQQLVPSWSLVRPSVQLIIQNIDTMLWLVILPAVLAFLASVLLNPFTVTLRDALNSQPTDAQLSAALNHFGNQLVTTSRGHVAVILEIVSIFWTFLVFPATIAFMARAASGKPADLRSSLSDGWRYFARIYAVSLLSAAVVIGGVFLFIVPGFIMLRRYVLAPFYVVSRDLGVNEAMQASAQEGKPYAAYIWGTLGVALAFLMLDGFFSGLTYVGAFIGLIFGYLYFFGLVLRYRTITEASKSSSKASKK